MNPREFETALSRLFDNDLDADELRQLENHLLQSSDARRLYFDYADLHAILQPALAAASPTTAAVVVARSLHRQRSRSALFATVAAAAVLVITAVVLALVHAREVRPAVAFRSSPGSVFTLAHAREMNGSGGSVLEPGSTLKLSQGAVEFKFKSGVRSVIQAPASIVLQSENMLRLHQGTGWFEVPTKARGFTVITDEMRVVDFGTVFCIEAHPDHQDEVHLFRGKVRTDALGGLHESREMTSPSALRVLANGHFETVPPQESRFASQLPSSLPYLAWSFDGDNPLAAQVRMPGAGNPAGTIQSPDSDGKGSHFQSGKFGNALKLQAPGEFFSADWTGITGDAPRSVAFWLKMPRCRLAPGDEINGAILVGWGEQMAGERVPLNRKWTVHLDYSADRHPMLNVSYGGFWYYFPTVVLDDDQWHHLAVVYNGNSNEKGHPCTTLYLDGEEINGLPEHHEPLDLRPSGVVNVDTRAKAPLVVGGQFNWTTPWIPNPKSNFTGNIDELHVISGAINRDQVRGLMLNNRLGR